MPDDPAELAAIAVANGGLGCVPGRVPPIRQGVHGLVFRACSSPPGLIDCCSPQSRNGGPIDCVPPLPPPTPPTLYRHRAQPLPVWPRNGVPANPCNSSLWREAVAAVVVPAATGGLPPLRRPGWWEPHRRSGQAYIAVRSHSRCEYVKHFSTSVVGKLTGPRIAPVILHPAHPAHPVPAPPCAGDSPPCPPCPPPVIQ